MGMTTMKTDVQRGSMEDQLVNFRTETQQLNPFSSQKFEQV
jgi:hypothetical protein